MLGVMGLLGTAIESICTQQGIDCIGLSHADIEITDFSNLKARLDRERPDVIINTVAIVGIDPCETEPIEAYRVNTLPAYQLAKYCQQRQITFIQVSTHAVFDGESEEPYTEKDLPNPTNIYSATKLMSETLAKNNCTRYYVIRVPSMFGQRRNNREGFTDKVRKWLNSGKPLKIADDKIDSPSYSKDIAEVLIRLIKDKEPYGVYHLANSGKVSLYEFVIEMANLTNKQIEVSRAKDSDFPSLAHKPLRTALVSEKLPPLRGWKQALDEYVNQLS